MTQRLTVRQLEYLVAVAEMQNFRRAAERCGVSQPALSTQIQDVEATLGVQLFERDRRSVLVTAAGTQIAARAKLALAAIDAVVDAARAVAEPLVGQLRLGVIPTVAPYWLPSMLPRVRAGFPRLELILREEQTRVLMAALASGQIDCALVALPVEGDFTAAPVVHEAFVVAARKRHPLFRGAKRIDERVLDTHDVLLLEDGHCLRDQALSVCTRAGAKERLGVRATSLPTLVQMVAGSDAITLLPVAAARVLAPAKGPVQTFRFTAPEPGRTLGLVWRTSSARLREFRMLAEAMASGAKELGD